MEVEVIELSLSCSISLKRTNNVHRIMKSHIFFSKLEVFSNFFAFSQVSRLIELIFLANSLNIDIHSNIFFNILIRLSIFRDGSWLNIVIFLGFYLWFNFRFAVDSKCSSSLLVLSATCSTCSDDGRIFLTSNSS